MTIRKNMARGNDEWITGAPNDRVSSNDISKNSQSPPTFQIRRLLAHSSVRVVTNATDTRSKTTGGSAGPSVLAAAVRRPRFERESTLHGIITIGTPDAFSTIPSREVSTGTDMLANCDNFPFSSPLSLHAYRGQNTTLSVAHHSLQFVNLTTLTRKFCS